MAQRVVLHVGTMKSGTSFLQGQLFAQKDRLVSHGVLVPGRSRGHQIRALQQGRSGLDDRDLWRDMEAQIRTHPGDVVLSSESLGGALRQTVRNLLPDLAPSTVEVVLTVRDLNRTLVSMWQETIQNGRAWTWDEYYQSVCDSRPPSRGPRQYSESAGGRFWKQQDVARMVTAWAREVGPDRVAVIAVPPRGADRSLLSARFIEATGIPLDPHLPSPRLNESLGLASVLVLRELNELLTAQGHAWSDSSRLLRKRLLAKRMLARRAAQEPRLGLEPPAWIYEQTAATIMRLKATGVRFVGQWSDLDPIPVAGIRPEDIDPRQVTSAAIAGLSALITHRIEPDSRRSRSRN